MHTRRFWAARFIWAVAIMVLAAGCASAGGSATLTSTAAAPGEADVTVAAIPAVDLAGLYIALDQGLFARQGLHVTIAKIPSSQTVIASQLRGQVDISAGSYVPYIEAQAAGARFRILAEASTLAPNTRVLVVTGNSPITTVAELAGRKIGVNGTSSIGTLLISMLLSANGISPAKVRFATAPGGFPQMPGELRQGKWQAAFLAEPYVTDAGEQYGEQVLADLDQGAALNMPIDGYVATQAWVRQHPGTAAAFTRAIEQGQAIANRDASAAQIAMSHYDDLPPQVTGAIAQTGYPVGPVVAASIQRVAMAMLKFGLIGRGVTAKVEQHTLVGSMVGAGS
jgi:NitT/TauT family transport system substrate-binding protein